MSTILSIETATQVCSVALHRDGMLLGVHELFIDKSHATHLAVMIRQLQTNCDIPLKDLDAVAVSKGPGSYTGLRIGVATAKGLCFALGIPLIGVNTLRAMAHNIGEIPFGVDYLCPMIDARRMEVYYLILNNRLMVISETRAGIVTGDSFTEWGSRGKIMFFGNGSEKCKEILNGSNSIFVSGLVPSAMSIGQLAADKLANSEIEDLAYFEPFYLKEFRTTVPKDKTGLKK